MNWDKNILENINIENIEHIEEKKKVAEKIADKVQDNQIIGFGSGSTSYLATIAIADKIKKENLQIVAIPTSFEIKMLCAYLEIPTTTLSEKKPDWSFDGADEVLSYLYHLGIENVVCTNDTSDIQRVRLKKVGLLPYIQEVYGGEYYFKPHEEAYIRACGSYVPSECMMVGDDFQKDVIGPRSLGISAWYYDPNGRNPEYEYSIKSLRKVKEMF